MSGYKHWILDTRDADVPPAQLFGFLHDVDDDHVLEHVTKVLQPDPENGLLKLNGGFSGYTIGSGEAIIFCDRFGFGKVYIADLPDGIIAGSSFNDVVRRLPSPEPDRIGILEFVRFGYPLSDRTFVTQVRVLPPASLVSYNIPEGRYRHNKRYWHYSFTETPLTNKSQRMEELHSVLTQAVTRCFRSKTESYAVGNSGGMDSRSILAVACDQGYDLTAYTLGSANTDAITIATKVASTLGIRQTGVEIPPDFMPHYAELHIERRPMITLASTWYCAALRHLSSSTVNVTGIYGDNTLGIHLVERYQDMANDGDLYDYHSLATDADLSPLVRGTYNDVRDHFDHVIGQCEQSSLVNRFDQWNFENRQFRFIMEEDWVTFLDTMKPRCPFMDNDLVDFGLSLPYKWRSGRRLYQEVISSQFPDIARIRLERSFDRISDGPIIRAAKASAMRMAKHIERQTHTRNLFRKRHKCQSEWMLSAPNLSFIRHNMRNSSPAFSALFDYDRIAVDMPRLIRNNWSVASNLLSTKLWLERFID